MPLTVHHLSVSQSDRIPWLCEELGIQYVLKTYKRVGGIAPAEYKALYPFSLREYGNIIRFLERVGERVGEREAFGRTMRKCDSELELVMGPDPPKELLE